MILDRISPEDMAEVSAIFEEAARMGMNLLKKVYELHQTQKDTGVKQELLQYSRENPFVFRGTQQDLSYFWSRAELPIEKIKELPDVLQEQVMRSFGEMQKQGLITFDGEHIRLTTEGNRYIHDTGYISEVVKADQELNQKIQESLAQTTQEQRFQPSDRAGSQPVSTSSIPSEGFMNPSNAAPVATQQGSVGGTRTTQYQSQAPVQSEPPTALSSPAPAQTAGNAAQTGAKAADTASKTAGNATNAIPKAGPALAAQIAQTAVTSLNKSINTLLTHRQ